MIIAHRGLHNKSIRENTLNAFDNAFNNNYDGIELDVRLTKDKVPVIVHDSFLSRISNVKGNVKDYTYDELKKINIGIDDFDYIPKFVDVIKRYQNKIIFIELKEDIDITKYLDNNNIYYIMSFNKDYIIKLPKSNNYKLGVINYIFNSNINYDKLDFVLILETFSNSTIVDYLSKKGIEIVIYGIIGKIDNYQSKMKYIY